MSVEFDFLTMHKVICICVTSESAAHYNWHYHMLANMQSQCQQPIYIELQQKKRVGEENSQCCFMEAEA